MLILISSVFGLSIFFVFKSVQKILSGFCKKKIKDAPKINIKNYGRLMKDKFSSLPEKRRKIFISLCSFLAVFIISSNIVFSLTASVLYIYIDWNIKTSKRKKFAALIDSQTIEAASIIKNAVLAGQSLQNALVTASSELNEPIKSQFKQMSDQILLGADFNKVLVSISQNAPGKEFKFMMDAIRLSKDSGAALSGIFEKIINCSSQRINIQNKITALTAQGKISGTITSCIPFLIILIMYVMQPDMIVVLFNTFIGNILLLAVIIMILIGSFVIRKLTEINF